MIERQFASVERSLFHRSSVSQCDGQPGRVQVRLHKELGGDTGFERLDQLARDILDVDLPTLDGLLERRPQPIGNLVTNLFKQPRRFPLLADILDLVLETIHHPARQLAGHVTIQQTRRGGCDSHPLLRQELRPSDTDRDEQRTE